MNKPAISIGLPVYNGEDFLREAIASVLSQSYQDFELIIRDNASTDQTEPICREFASRDIRIRYIRNATNAGAGPNFNGIVAHAQGRYFKWLAHDDVLAPTFLARCIDALEKDATAVLACPRVRHIDARGEPLEDYISPFRTDDDHRVVRFSELLRDGYRCFEVFGLIRIKELKQTHLIGNYNHGDGVLLTHLALLGRFADIPEYLFHSRQHEKQSMYLFGAADNRFPPDFEAYANWFNPNNQVGLSRSFNKAFVEYLWMVRTTPMSVRERLACYRAVARWFLVHWRSLAGEWKRTIYRALGLPSQPRQRKPGLLTAGNTKLASFLRKFTRPFRIALLLPWWLQLVCVLASPEIRVVLRHNWRKTLVPISSYLSPALRRKERIATMTHHYSFVRRNLDKDFLTRIHPKPMALWQENANGVSHQIVLSVSPPEYSQDREGDLSLLFMADAICIFKLSFTICPGSVFNVDADHVMCIGRLQGGRDMMDLIRASTKRCQDTAQHTLLLAVAQGICLSLNIGDIVCRSSRGQHSFGQDGRCESDSVYDEFWKAMGAARISDYLYHMPCPVPKKPLELLDQHRRKRAAKRRKYRDAATDQARATFCSLFMKERRSL